MDFWLGVSTAGHLCVDVDIMLSMLFPTGQANSSKKRGQVKIRATRISYTELFCNVVENFYFITAPVGFLPLCWWLNWSVMLQCRSAPGALCKLLCGLTKETKMWELNSIPGWALCSSYEELGIWLPQIWAFMFQCMCTLIKSKNSLICCKNYFLWQPGRETQKELQDKLILCERKQWTIPSTPQVYELSSLIFSIFFI